MTVLEIKSSLLDACKTGVKNRFEKVNSTIAGIVESLNDETKSSAGDKHETGRAMLQIDRENAGKQLLELENLQRLLPKIDIKTTTDYARLGSIVYTNHGTYFISISHGAVTIDNTIYYCVALQAPIARQLSGKKTGDNFIFNNKTYTVTSVK
ncbi:hypothetical protein SCB49_05757 [unidentified eubacterium SCB49]|nr:hypothetical protein SCB49_05757 [unidentified eubacterium SCB49]